jgi:hypothetical protein
MKLLPVGNFVSLRNVATGGKGSTVDKSIGVQLEAIEASPGSCPTGATSEPTTVSLFIEDDDGDVVFTGSGEGFVCSPGVKLQANFDMRFQGPENCKDSAIPSGQATDGDLFVNASTEHSSLNEVRTIRCSK